jgi:hypothetical protein
LNEADSDSDNSDDIARRTIARAVNEIGCNELRRYERMLAEDSQ